MKKLILHNNEINISSGNQIGNMLAMNTHLEYLDLSNIYNLILKKGLLLVFTFFFIYT